MKNKQKKNAAEIKIMKSENKMKIVEYLNIFDIEKCDENINLPEKEAKIKINDEIEMFRQESNFDSSELSHFVKAKKKKVARKKIKDELMDKLPVFECFELE